MPTGIVNGIWEQGKQMEALKIDFTALATDKERCFKFLSDLQAAISAGLPAPDVVNAEVARLVQARAERHVAFGEGAFLYTYIVPVVAREVRRVLGENGDAARQALAAESFKAVPDIASANPWRRIAYPFQKGLGASPKEVVELWRTEKGVVDKLAPDFALRAPFPHKIVFEGKYVYRSVSVDKAAEMLTIDIYQGFFYRGLPKSPGGNFADYDYDYACVVIGDATKDGAIKQAWETFHPRVRQSFWDGANIFVMIV
jgi:hypothetical protein